MNCLTEFWIKSFKETSYEDDVGRLKPPGLESIRDEYRLFQIASLAQYVGHSAASGIVPDDINRMTQLVPKSFVARTSLLVISQFTESRLRPGHLYGWWERLKGLIPRALFRPGGKDLLDLCRILSQLVGSGAATAIADASGLLLRSRPLISNSADSSTPADDDLNGVAWVVSSVLVDLLCAANGTIAKTFRSIRPILQGSRIAVLPSPTDAAFSQNLRQTIYATVGDKGMILIDKERVMG